MLKEKNVCFIIKHLEGMMMRSVCGKFPHKEEKSSMMEGWIIDYLFLHRDQVVYQKDLEMQFRLPKSTIATILKKMEKKNMLLRAPAEGDTRLKVIRLSEEGYQVHEQVTAVLSEMNELMCEGVTQEEITAFLSVCNKFIHNLANNMKGSECRI